MYCFDIRLVMNTLFQKRARKTRSGWIVVQITGQVFELGNRWGGRAHCAQKGGDGSPCVRFEQETCRTGVPMPSSVRYGGTSSTSSGFVGIGGECLNMLEGLALARPVAGRGARVFGNAAGLPQKRRGAARGWVRGAETVGVFVSLFACKTARGILDLYCELNKAYQLN